LGTVVQETLEKSRKPGEIQETLEKSRKTLEKSRKKNLENSREKKPRGPENPGKIQNAGCSAHLQVSVLLLRSIHDVNVLQREIPFCFLLLCSYQTLS
jgi:hypothetical protein